MRYNNPMKLLILALPILIALAPPDAEAMRPVRCNGRIQFKPCTVDAPSNLEARRVQRTAKRHSQAQFARVIDPKLTKVASGRGNWHGRVEGNGTITLSLQILRRGVLESKLHMGSVVLRNKSTPFSFLSSLPRGGDWSWNIIAAAS